MILLASAECILQTFCLCNNHSQYDYLANGDAEPPLGVKPTVYRLLNVMTILSFVISKDILTMEGQVAAPTRLDWVSGGVLGVV